ncbi:MAG: 6-carboxytetrahydropterin synthase [Acidobacteria bacterium]|nr:6-carboxytetrahydropterin synthase [Acidobacteriota bacterium]
MPTVRLTRRYRFSAAHRLATPLLSAEENRAVFGKCNNPHGHGHDFTVELSLLGAPDERTGRLVPLAALDQFASEVVLKPFDRRNMNVEIADFAALVPTTENLAVVLARRVASAWPVWFAGSPARFEKLRIWETKRNIFEMSVPAAPEGEEAGRESHSDEIIQSRSSTV